MSRIFYDAELGKLKVDLIEMAAISEKMIDDGIKALLENDLKLAKDVITRDKDVDNLEHIIEKQCLHLFLKQQPVAKDFREVSAILKMITDIERIGDQAADICELILSSKNGGVNKSCYLSDMAKCVQTMVSGSVQSFVDGNIELAMDIIERDNEADDLFDKIKDELIDLIRQDGKNADNALLTLMIAKYLERIADHATNICEWVGYSINGEK